VAGLSGVIREDNSTMSRAVSNMEVDKNAA
jgi:hypothetical protein